MWLQCLLERMELRPSPVCRCKSIGCCTSHRRLPPRARPRVATSEQQLAARGRSRALRGTSLTGKSTAAGTGMLKGGTHSRAASSTFTGIQRCSLHKMRGPDGSVRLLASSTSFRLIAFGNLSEYSSSESLQPSSLLILCNSEGSANETEGGALRMVTGPSIDALLLSIPLLIPLAGAPITAVCRGGQYLPARVTQQTGLR
jgi:hypothetical protein